MALYKLLASLIICLGAAAIGGIVTGPSVATWYVTVQKPWFTPPNELFAPVWTLLYLLMGLALYLIWIRRGNRANVDPALLLFGCQLALNVAWSVVFFGFQSTGGGFAVIVLLWLAIGLTIESFRRISKLAAWFLVPYWAWVSFATVLNYAIWRLNS